MKCTLICTTGLLKLLELKFLQAPALVMANKRLKADTAAQSTGCSVCFVLTLSMTMAIFMEKQFKMRRVSIKTGIFMETMGKNTGLSTKVAVFMDNC